MLIDPLEASPRQAAEALGDVASVRGRTRRSLGEPWFPLVCFGTLTMISAPVVAAAGVEALAPMWLVAGSAGMLLTRRHYRQRGRHRGVTGRGRGGWVVGWGMFVGCLAAGVAAGMLSGAAAGVLAPIVVVAAGYLVLGWLRRSLVASLAIAPGTALAIAFVLVGLAPWIVELTFGSGLVLAGLGVRAAQMRS